MSVLVPAVVVRLTNLRVLICIIIILLIKIGRHRHLRLHLYLSFGLVNLHLGRAVDENLGWHGWHGVCQLPQVFVGVGEAAQVAKLA